MRIIRAEAVSKNCAKPKQNIGQFLVVLFSNNFIDLKIQLIFHSLPVILTNFFVSFLHFFPPLFASIVARILPEFLASKNGGMGGRSAPPSYAYDKSPK